MKSKESEQARQNEPVNELSVDLPISACYSRSLSWLLDWFPRPTVKLKFVAQLDDELYEEWGSKELGFDIIEIDAGSLGIPEEILPRYVRLVKTGVLRAKPLFAVKFNKSDIPMCGDRAYGSYTVPVQRTYELVKDVNLLIRRAERCIEARVDMIMIDAEDVCRQADSLGNLKEERVNITELQSYKLSSYQKSTSYLAVENSDTELELSDSKQQLKNSESLPTARPNALVGELDVISPISAYYCVSLWMFIWGPKPMVKMKLMAHHGEVIEEDLNSMVFPISKKFKEAKFLAIVLPNAMTRELVVTLIVVKEVRLSVWNLKPKVKMKLRKSASRVGYEEETTDFGKSTGSSSVMKKAYQLSDIDWLVLIWFPKPTVKMKHERLGSGIREVGSMIPWGQGILRGRDCYDHNCRSRRLCIHDQHTCMQRTCTTYIELAVTWH